MELVRTVNNIHDRQKKTLPFARLILVALGKNLREMEHAPTAMTMKNSKEKTGHCVDLIHALTYKNYY